MNTTTWDSHNETSTINKGFSQSFQRPCLRYLGNGDGQDEPGWGAVGVAVKVPLAVDLSGQSLIGNVSHESLGQPQPGLVSEAAASELPAPLQDGSPEAVGALVAHLDEGGSGRWKRWRIMGGEVKAHRWGKGILYICTLLIISSVSVLHFYSKSVRQRADCPWLSPLPQPPLCPSHPSRRVVHLMHQWKKTLQVWMRLLRFLSPRVT